MLTVLFLSSDIISNLKDLTIYRSEPLEGSVDQTEGANRPPDPLLHLLGQNRPQPVLERDVRCAAKNPPRPHCGCFDANTISHTENLCIFFGWAFFSKVLATYCFLSHNPLLLSLWGAGGEIRPHNPDPHHFCHSEALMFLPLNLGFEPASTTLRFLN